MKKQKDPPTIIGTICGILIFCGIAAFNIFMFWIVSNIFN